MSQRLLMGLLSGAAILMAANIFIWHNTAIGVLLGTIYFVSAGYLLGTTITLPGPIIRITAGILLWLAILSGVSGAVYAFLNLAPTTVVSLILLSPFLLKLIIKAMGQRALPNDKQDIPINPRPDNQETKSLSFYVGLCFLLTLIAAGLLILINARSDEALRSPWSVVPYSFFAVFFTACLFTLLLAMDGQDGAKFGPKIFCIIALAGLSLSVALIVYKVGYGFDPFVHRATEDFIFQQGVVTPKKLYYLGQYGLVITLSSIFQANVSIIDKIILPLAASVTLPLVLIYGLLRLSRDRRAILITALAALALPLRWFIGTTPQGLASLVLLTIIFLYFTVNQSQAKENDLSSKPHLSGPSKGELYLLWALAIIATIIHPLAGLPALMLLSLSLASPHWSKKHMIFFLAGLFIIFTPIIPLLFIFQEWIMSGALPTSTAVLGWQKPPSFSGWLYLTERYNVFLDALYYYGFNIPVLLIILAAIGLRHLYIKDTLKKYLPLLMLSTLMAIDGIILNYFLPFNFLIGSERTAYGDRLMEMSFFFLLPFALTALLIFAEKLAKSSVTVIFFWLLVIASFKTAGLYLTYPRFDTYAYDGGYSPSAHDLKAVRAIDEQSSGPYIVLANQAVSAAALRELGFKKYFTRLDGKTNEQIFFYPIPTGGSLYQYYLKMVYEEPHRQTVEEAMDLVGVNEAYFILNDYWADAQKIAAAARADADNLQILDGGKIYIFKYLKSAHGE